MSVLGIDIGASSAVLATVKSGAVSIVRNEVSERLTPTLVSYTDKERLLGDAALATIRSNAPNTCRYMKMLLGCVPECVQEEKEFSLATIGNDTDGFLCYVLQDGTTVNVTQVMAALLGRLKKISETSLQRATDEVVISVPSWYGDASRRAMLTAAKMANLKVLRLLNEHAAISVDYGIFRSRTFTAEQPTHVCFVSMGHAQTTVCVTEFLPDKLKIKSVVCDPTLGGRNMDKVLMEHLAQTFQQTTGLNPLGKSKARLKLEESASKAKKVLSANSDTTVSVEYLMEEKDLSVMVKREEFVQMCRPLRDQLVRILQAAVQDAAVNLASVEVVGGCTRIPWVQQAIQETTGLAVQKTLSSDETVARGCALQAAMLSTRFKVRDFAVGDHLRRTVLISFGEDVAKPEQHALFSAGTLLDTTKAVTIHRTGPFGIQLRYEEHDPRQSSDLGVWMINLPEAQTKQKVKVHIRLSLHGTVDVVSAQRITERVEQVTEEIEEEVPVSPQPSAATPAGVDTPMEPAPAPEAVPPAEEGGAAGEAAPATPPAETKRVKRQVVKNVTKVDRVELAFVCSDRPQVFSEAQVQALVKYEEQMRQRDQVAAETRDMLNMLEEYIYKTRSSLDTDYVQYFQSKELAALEEQLKQTEAWLWDHMEETHDVYRAEYDRLRKVEEPGRLRREEEMARILKAQQEEERKERELQRELEEQKKEEAELQVAENVNPAKGEMADEQVDEKMAQPDECLNGVSTDQ